MFSFNIFNKIFYFFKVYFERIAKIGYDKKIQNQNYYSFLFKTIKTHKIQIQN